MTLTRNLAGRKKRRETCILVPVFTAVMLLILPPAAETFCGPSQSKPNKPTRERIIQKALKDIHAEVLEMGGCADDDFIKQEFWFELDGVEENKEEHVVVIQHNDGLNLKMIVQITYFTRDENRRFVRFAEDTKSVFCRVSGGGPEIDRSDYSDEEMETLLPGILKGIRIEKEILKLIEKKF